MSIDMQIIMGRNGRVAGVAMCVARRLRRRERLALRTAAYGPLVSTTFGAFIIGVLDGLFLAVWLRVLLTISQWPGVVIAIAMLSCLVLVTTVVVCDGLRQVIFRQMDRDPSVQIYLF